MSRPIIYKKKLNKLSSCVIIPKGKKCKLEFKTIKDKPVCILFDCNNKIHKKIYVSFNPLLSLGTIIYGTIRQNTIICESLHLYKNEKVTMNQKEQIKLLEIILTNYVSYSNEKNIYNLKLPYIFNTIYNNIILDISNLNYDVYGIMQLDSENTMFKLSQLFGYFKIIKKNEVYELYHSEYYHSNAYVNTIRCSYLLKRLFNIKTNYKTIEYSDEEDDSIKDEEYIVCIYIPSLKKWKPYSVNKLKRVDTNEQIKKVEYNSKFFYA